MERATSIGITSSGRIDLQELADSASPTAFNIKLADVSHHSRERSQSSKTGAKVLPAPELLPTK